MKACQSKLDGKCQESTGVQHFSAWALTKHDPMMSKWQAYYSGQTHVTFDMRYHSANLQAELGHAVFMRPPA
jgi:hypothetical protein